MIGTGDKADRFGVEHPVAQRQLQRPSADASDNHIHHAGEQIVKQRRHDLLFDIQVQGRHLFEQFEDRLRDAVGRHRRTANHQAAHLSALLKTLDLILRTRHIVNQPLGVLKQQLPAFGRAQAFAMAFEQNHADFVFKLAEPFGERGLSNVHHFRHLREIALLPQRHQHL